MALLLVAITFMGFCFSSIRPLKLGNPFQIYFLIWLMVFLMYLFTAETYINIDGEFWLLMLSVKGAAFTLLIFSRYFFCGFKWSMPAFYVSHKKLIFLQLVVIFLMPFAYLKALELSGGDIFSVLGYIQLRTSMTEDGLGYGLISYVLPLACILAALSVVENFAGRLSATLMLISIISALLYIYISTARTSIMLLIAIIVMALTVIGYIRTNGIILFAILLMANFIFVAAMTSKGISFDSDFSSNVNSFSENIRSYTIAPLVAFSKLINSGIDYDFGKNTFRLFFVIMFQVGMVENPPFSLIRDYSYVPDATNVYTVYEAYFRDFSYLGVFLPVIFLLLHGVLYYLALRRGGRWIFYYCASVYPLIMQFFQDQYFSLFSQWIQVAFWFWLLVDGNKNKYKLELHKYD